MTDTPKVLKLGTRMKTIQMDAPPADIILIGQGSLVGFRPASDAAKQWFADNVSSEDWQWFGQTLWVDHRLARDLLFAIANDTDFSMREQQ